jgi:hypothetical protein
MLFFNRLKKIALPAALLALFACNLTKDVEIDLPDYATQPVVECYLEPGKPFRMLLTKSYSFFDPFGLDSNFIDNTLLQGATVTIRYEGRTDTLRNIFAVDGMPLKLYNYVGTNLVPATVGLQYELDIQLPNNGGTITGQATMLNRVPIDSVVVEFSPEVDTLARALTYITDDLGQKNYYRRLLNYATLDSLPQQDFLVDDRISTNALIAFGTGYELRAGDTIFNAVFHISKEYYDYLESYQLAIIGNVNPFAQPSAIKSNVRGSAKPLGIFTCLVFDRDTSIVRR